MTNRMPPSGIQNRLPETFDGPEGEGGHTNWPFLPDEALHGFVGELVRAATQNSEADPAATLATILTHAGIAAGRGPYVRVGDDRHHARLFAALVGKSARARKGTSEAPVRRVADQAAKVGASLPNWVHGPMSSGEGLIYSIRDGDGKQEGDPGIADKRLLIVEGEFGAPLKAMQRSGNTLSTTIRSAWDGKTLAPLVKGSYTQASQPHIGIVGHITEIELRSLLSNVDVHNGFANRFLWCCTRRAKLLPLAAGLSEADITQLGKDYAERLKYAQALSEVEFTDNARSLYENIYSDLSEDHLGMYGIIVARAEAQVIRLALTYALIDASPLITSDHLQAALATWDYCDASAKYLFQDASLNPLENRILEVLRDTPLTQSELHKNLGGHTEGAGLNSALKNLERHGRVQRNTISTGGRPKNTWSLRPVSKPANEAKKAKKAKNGQAVELSSLNSLHSQVTSTTDGPCHS